MKNKRTSILIIASLMIMLLASSVMAVESSITDMEKPTSCHYSNGDISNFDCEAAFMSDSERGGAYDFGWESENDNSYGEIVVNVAPHGFGTDGFEIVLTEAVTDNWGENTVYEVSCGTEDLGVLEEPRTVIDTFTINGQGVIDFPDITIPSSCFDTAYDIIGFKRISSAGGFTQLSQIRGYVQVGVVNTAPVINSISPTYGEIKSGTDVTFTSDITDTEGDISSYIWSIVGDGNVLGTSSSFTASYEDVLASSNVQAGIHTLQLYVTDGEYTDTHTTTLELRKAGGSPSGSSGNGPAVIPTENANEQLQDNPSSENAKNKLGQLLDRFTAWFRNFFGLN